MPSFPRYRGYMPAVLQPWNPGHWLLLAYWIYFQPTALKCYLYTADPELYTTWRGWASMRRAFSRPAYRHALISAAIVLSLLAVALTRLASAAQGTPVNWWGVTLGVAVCVALGVVLSVIVGVAWSVVWSIALGITICVAWGVSFGIFWNIVFSISCGLVFGVVGGMIGDVAVGMASSLVFGVVWVIAMGVAVDLAVDIIFGVTFGVAAGLAGLAGSLRLPWYPIQLLLTLAGRRHWQNHPVLTDELLVLPLPRKVDILDRALSEDLDRGLYNLACVARNPFQRWAAQKALYLYLHRQHDPLHLLQQILDHPDMRAFLIASTEGSIRPRLTTARQLLLGELAGHRIEVERADGWIWRLTHNLRERESTPLTHFAGILANLLKMRDNVQPNFNLQPARSITAGLATYPGGADLAIVVGLLTDLIAANNLDQIARAGIARAIEPVKSAERPFVQQPFLAALRRLDAARDQVAIYRAATSRANRQAALLRATEMLQSLAEDVQELDIDPERAILRRIIEQWQELIIAEGGEVGREVEHRPVTNPYISTNPVTGSLFVGREDVLLTLESLWSSPERAPSIVIYGHRRMGKTSILHNLGARFGANTVIVDFNMQRVGAVRSDAHLLYYLAVTIYDACRRQGINGLEEPVEAGFVEASPTLAFNRFLDQLADARRGRRMIVTVDEFEKLEDQIAAGRLTTELIDFWRATFMTFPWFIMAFAGLYELEERRHDYWNPLFGSVKAIRVSFLSPAAARQLIVQPSEDFDIDYDEDAIAEIIELTSSQPSLIQRIGENLVARFNQQVFEEGIDRARRFSLEDVRAVIEAPTFMLDASAYFDGVWSQAERSAPPGQTDILIALAPCHTGLARGELAAALGKPDDQVSEALATLRRHDVVVGDGIYYRFAVELMRRWVEQKHFQ